MLEICNLPVCPQDREAAKGLTFYTTVPPTEGIPPEGKWWINQRQKQIMLFKPGQVMCFPQIILHTVKDYKFGESIPSAKPDFGYEKLYGWIENIEKKVQSLQAWRKSCQGIIPKMN